MTGDHSDNPHIEADPTEEACEGCGKQAILQEVPGHAWRGGPACWVSICDACAEGGNPRQRGDDDGVEYGDPRGDD